MNSVILIGNLARDPELRYSTGANQTAICRFTVAVNDGYGEKQRTSFIQIVTFGKTAENCEKYLAKGRKVAVNGRIQTGSYEKDGRTVYTTEVVASNVEFLGGGQGGQQGGQSSFSGQGGFDAPSGGEDMDVPGGGFTSLQDDDIPF
ncbi:MAG: single-stranded DNA-binding protein [Clostridia bacterium]|nr:single-stranded DNA-binding protein [Clostridia bacterium]